MPTTLSSNPAPAAPTPDESTPLPERPRREAEKLTEADGAWARAAVLPRTLYWGVHAAALAALWWRPGGLELGLLAATFAVRMFAITAGYHRYFAHRGFRTGRAFQFVLALVGCSAAQKGPLWWAGIHRHHHRFADGPGDPHSPRDGFWYAHQGWIFDPRWNATPIESIRDFARYPELVWLNRWHFAPVVGLALLCFAIGGLPGLMWGFAVSTTLLWHATYTINSLAHRFGSRRFDTPDTSRNNPWLALLTFGEGWHNNHHFYMASARQGFRWWEVDLTYYVLRALARVGIVWGLREPPASVLRGSADSGPARDSHEARAA